MIGAVEVDLVVSPRGKHDLVREEVTSLVASLQVGDALPPERRLAESLGVSRMTLRRAVEELVREGRLVRRQGAGTFVSEARPISQSLHASSFSAEMRRQGLEPSSRVLALERRMAGAQLGARLVISPGEEILLITRLRLADEVPMALEHLAVPRALVPGLRGEELEAGSFYALLAERFGIVVHQGVQTIEATVTTEEEAALLEVPLHSPAFLFERTTRDEQDRTIEFVRSVYPGSRYRLTASLHTPDLTPAVRAVRGRDGDDGRTRAT